MPATMRKLIPCLPCSSSLMIVLLAGLLNACSQGHDTPVKTGINYDD